MPKTITGKEIQVPGLDRTDPSYTTRLEDLGRQTAESLLAEIKLPENAFSTDQLSNLDVLCNEIPGRTELGFCEYQEKGVKKHPTKDAVFSKMSKDGFVAFCCASIEAQVVKVFDMDHVFPFAKIKERQEVLLKCLNLRPANKDFADAFLATPGINTYFRRDKNGDIKGTKRFFYACFNDVSNLLPIIHHINREKSDRSTKG